MHLEVQLHLLPALALTAHLNTCALLPVLPASMTTAWRHTTLPCRHNSSSTAAIQQWSALVQFMVKAAAYPTSCSNPLDDTERQGLATRAQLHAAWPTQLCYCCNNLAECPAPCTKTVAAGCVPVCSSTVPAAPAQAASPGTAAACA